jgi:Flp pilus assembly protein TadB
VALNPAIKIDLADGWFGRMLDKTPSHYEHTPSDDPIRDLRRSYTKDIQREQRIEGIGRFVVFLFFWFIVSFVIVCLSPLVLARPLAVPLAAVIGGVAACLLWLLRRSKVFKTLTK